MRAPRSTASGIGEDLLLRREGRGPDAAREETTRTRWPEPGRIHGGSWRVLLVPNFGPANGWWSQPGPGRTARASRIRIVRRSDPVSRPFPRCVQPGPPRLRPLTPACPDGSDESGPGLPLPDHAGTTRRRKPVRLNFLGKGGARSSGGRSRCRCRSTPCRA